MKTNLPKTEMWIIRLREKHDVLEEQVSDLILCHGGNGAVLEPFHYGHDQYQ